MDWKIYQINTEEYILISDSEVIRKIKGANASDIINVLKFKINKEPSIHIQKTFEIESLKNEYISDIEEWLLYNNFYSIDSKNSYNINIIGEFGVNSHFLENFKKNIPKNININTITNLSNGEYFENNENVDLNLVIGPLFYNQEHIKYISFLQKNSPFNFLYTELYLGGILLGPLMNTEKETVCMNCIEKRKVFNFLQSDIVESFIKDDLKSITFNDVFMIGNYEINKTLIYNELLNVLFKSSKKLYNRSLYIDFNNYNNQDVIVLKSPNCEFCNPINTYNPL